MTVHDRQKLYEEVWKEPLTTICKRYSLSDVGLRKVCVRLKIPLPPAGYWAKVYAGRAVIPTPPLPIYNHTGRPLYWIERVREPEVPMADEFKTIADEVAAEPNPIVVPDPGKRHRLVVATARAFKKPAKDSRGILFGDRTTSLDITVSAQNLGRALDIADALIKALERHHCRVFIEKHRTYVQLHDQQMTLVISEAAKQSDVPLSKEDLARQKQGLHVLGPKRQFTPTGRLHLVLNGQWKIVDTTKTRLEDRLRDVVLEVVRRADENARLAELRRLAAIERARNQNIAREKKAVQDAEIKRLKNLEWEVSQWERAQKLRAYIDAVEQAFSAGTLTVESQQEWLSWARAKADWIDPLVQRPDPIMDENINLYPW